MPAIGRRPVVVLSRDATIPRLRTVIVAPCTTTVRGLATEVLLEPSVDPVTKACVVSLDSVHDSTLGQLTQRLGALSDARMREVCAALAIAVDCR